MQTIRRLVIGLTSIALFAGLALFTSPAARAEPAPPPKVAVMATGTVFTLWADPAYRSPAAAEEIGMVRLADGTWLPLSDPGQAGDLEANDEVRLGVMVPAEVVAALSAADAAALAAQPVEGGVVRVPDSAELGAALLATTVAATPEPTLVDVEVTRSPAPVPMDTPASPQAAVPSNALNQTLDLVIASSGSTRWLTEAAARSYISDMQAWYRANTGLNITFSMPNGIKFYDNSPYICGAQASTIAQWDQAAKMFGHSSADWYLSGAPAGRHLVVLEDQTACWNPPYGGLGSSFGTPSLALTGVTMNRLVDFARPYSINNIAHELGHNFGLAHSHAQRCTSTSGNLTWNQGFLGTCQSNDPYDLGGGNNAHAGLVDYGDGFDFMGFGELPGAMSAVRKNQLKILDTAAVKSVTGAASAQRIDLTAVPTGNNSYAQLLRIPDSVPDKGVKDPLAGMDYWVELRHYSIADPVHTGSYAGYAGGYRFAVVRASATETWLHQPVMPTIPDFTAYALGAGATFTSADGLIQIKVISVPANSCTASCYGAVEVTRKLPPTAIATATISKTNPLQGDVLTANATGVVPSNATLSYQWYRNGVTIPGATGKTYQAAQADVGKGLRVRIWANAPGHVSTAALSAATSNVVGVFSAPNPTIDGMLQPGQTLTVRPGNWVPVPTSWSYQWLRDGIPIAGAKGASYKLTSADAWRVISVRIAGGRADYQVATRTSAGVTPKLPCTRFTDVPPSNQFYDAVCWAQAFKITAGSPAGSTRYSPNNPVTRGSMAAFLYRLAGSPDWKAPAKSPFVDVDRSNQFYHSITWLYAQKITVGTKIGGKLYYQPGNAVNRGSMAAFLRRFVGSPAFTPKANPFTDLTKANQFYDSILWLADQKITVGSTVKGKLVYQSSNPVTRQSMAAFLKRLSLGGLQCGIHKGAVGC